ncbi:MAG: YeeE/YedE family protein [Oligoflexales bacterium]
MNPYLASLLGGVVIGLATSILLLFKGRVFGISGIIGGLVKPVKGDIAWRAAILSGLIGGGVVMYFLYPSAFPQTDSNFTRYVIAGLLVGFGTQLGGGCTSGHGVCGISRLSPRSLLATVTFILSGVVTVAILNWMGV